MATLIVATVARIVICIPAAAVITEIVFRICMNLVNRKRDRDV